MSGPQRGYTTPHRCLTVDSSRRNQLSDRDRQARQRLQEKTSDFQVTFDECVYLSLGPETKRDIYNMFDPGKPFNIHLDPPSTEQPPLVQIKQEGKTSVYTTNFYFTNKLPSSTAVRPQGENNNTPTTDQAVAADPTLFYRPSTARRDSFTFVDVIHITSTCLGFNRRTQKDQGRYRSCFSCPSFMSTRRRRTEV